MSKTTAAIIAALIAALSWRCSEKEYKYTLTDAVESYDPLSGTWSNEERMPGRRVAPACAEAGGFIYVSGGTGGRAAHTYSFFRFDPQAGTWEGLPLMATSRVDHEMVRVGTDLYLLGGRNPTVDIFDTISETWFTAPDMTASRGSFGAAEVGGIIYVMGGWDGQMTLDVVEAYDPGSGFWQSLMPLPGPSR